MEKLGKTLAIVNPAAHNGDGARGAAFLRYAAGSASVPFSSVEVVTTRAAGHASELAAAASGFDTVLGVGGDGVVHEIIGGLMRIQPEVRPAFALLPCGNGNDFARTLGLPFDLERALHALSGAHADFFDVGQCNGRYFAQTLSFGLDAAIALGTHERRERTGHTGTRLFVEEGANQLLFHRDAYGYTLTCDGATRQGSMHLFAVQNGPTYGGGFSICPEAKPTDGLLDCCIASAPLGFAKAALLFARAKDGHHVSRPEFEFFQAGSMKLEFDTQPPAQIDGESIEGSTFQISLHPGALKVFTTLPAQG